MITTEKVRALEHGLSNIGVVVCDREGLHQAMRHRYILQTNTLEFLAICFLLEGIGKWKVEKDASGDNSWAVALDMLKGLLVFTENCPDKDDPWGTQAEAKWVKEVKSRFHSRTHEQKLAHDVLLNSFNFFLGIRDFTAASPETLEEMIRF